MQKAEESVKDTEGVKGALSHTVSRLRSTVMKTVFVMEEENAVLLLIVKALLPEKRINVKDTEEENVAKNKDVRVQHIFLFKNVSSTVEDIDALLQDV